MRYGYKVTSTTRALAALLLMLLLLTGTSLAQLTGTKTIGAGGDYATVQAAISALNSSGVGSGGVTFNVPAGHREIMASVAAGRITATGTAANPIVFQKNGGGNNPILTSAVGASTTVDGIITLAGTDYITFNGIDLYDTTSNATATTQMEWGYSMVKASGTAPFNGCEYVTVKNCSVTLQRANTASVAVYSGNHVATSTTSLTITATTDANNNITIDNVTIRNAFSGVSFNGYTGAASPYTLFDQNLEVKNCNIQNYAGGAATGYGIAATGANNFVVYNNTVINDGASGVAASSTIYGIYARTGTNSNFTARANTVQINKGSNTSAAYGVRWDFSGNITVNANTLQNFVLGGSSGTLDFIYTTTTCSSITVDSNTVTNSTSLNTTGSITVISLSSATNTYNVRYNTISNIARLTATSGSMRGFYNFGSPTGGTATVTNNTIYNLSSNSSTATSGSAGFIGIAQMSSTSQIAVVSNNIVRKLTGGSGGVHAIATNYGTSASACSLNTIDTITSSGLVYGIAQGSNATQWTYSQNTIRTLSSTSSSGATVAAIFLTPSSSSTGTNVISRNNIYDLTGSGSSAVTYGIYQSTGSANNTIANNFISDLRAPAASSTLSVIGIGFASGSLTLNNGVYYNSIYLNASSSSSFFGSTCLYTSTSYGLDSRNNVFVNMSAAGNGSALAKTAAYRRSSSTLTNYQTTSNYNAYYVNPSAASKAIFMDGTNYDSTMAAFKSRMSTRDQASIYENPPFLNVASTPYNLHMDEFTPTQLESGGALVAGITTDYDGDLRSGSTPDIGADEFSGVGADLTGPSISYTALGNSTSTTSRGFSSVTITDLSGINGTAGTRPRVYFKKSTNANSLGATNDNTTDGWKYVEANGSSSPFDFTMDLTKINGGLAVADTVQYFVVAQDNATTPNVSINSGAFTATPSSVALTAGAFPITSSINAYVITGAFSGTYNVGTGETYTSLTANAADGFFKAINGGVVTGDITVNITSDITETGAVGLNATSEEGVGNYKIKIQPSAAAARVLSGSTASSSSPLILINGADRVTIDGSFGGDGNRWMTIRNTNATTSSTGPALSFNNGATSDTVKYCVIEGNGTTAASGTVFFGTTGPNRNIVLSYNQIRDAQAKVAGTPVNAVYAGSAVDSVITFSNNQIFNFTAYGVYFTGVGGGSTFSNNSFYQTAARSAQIYNLYCTSTVGGGFTISNNSVGGSAADRSGTAHSQSSGAFYGFYLQGQTAGPVSTVSGNTVGNLSTASGSGTYGFYLATSGNFSCSNNYFGGLVNSWDSIRTNYDTYGFYTTSAGTVSITNNTIRQVTNSGTSNVWLVGVYSSTGTNTISGNTIRDLYNNDLTSTSTTASLTGIYLSTSSTNNTVSGNTIYNLSLYNSGSTAIRNMNGIYLASVGTGTVVTGNKVYGISSAGTGTGTSAPFIVGIQAFSGSATYANNFISLGSGVTTGESRFLGFYDAGSGTNNYYFNSVHIAGNTAAGSNSSHGFNRAGTATVTIKNNIFNNTRTTSGTGYNLAIANTNAAATGWAASASNNNVLNASNISAVGQWLSAGSPVAFSSWKSSSSGDAASFSGATVTFTDAANGNLHLNMGVSSTSLESNGAVIGGYTTDYDGDSRPGPAGSVNGGATAPDIGADEFDGVPLIAMVYDSSRTIQSVTSNVFANSTNNQVISIKVSTTNGGNALSAGSFYFKSTGTTDTANIRNAKLFYTGSSSTFSTGTQAGSTVAFPGNSFTINAATTLTEGANYFWLTYDIAAGATSGNLIDAQCDSLQVAGITRTPSVTAPSGTRSVLGSLNGSYTISSTAPNPFTTITEAFSVITSLGVAGPVTLNLDDATYSSGETFPLTLGVVTGASAVNTITLKPAAGKTVTISGSSSSGIFKFNGTDYFTIDGSNNGSTSRNLTISNSSASISSVIWFASQGTAAGCAYDTVKNTVIKAGAVGTSGIYGIFAGGTSLGTAGDDNDYMGIVNDSIAKAYIGIYVYATATGVNDNLLISGNYIGSASASDYIGHDGIMVAQATGALITQNTIFNMLTSATTPVALTLGSGVVSSTVSRNNIYNIKYTSTSGYGARGMYIAVGNASANLTIANNLISRIGGDGYTGFSNSSPVGLYIDGTTAQGAINFYYNSVYMSDTLTYVPSSGTVLSTALYATGTLTALDIRNNIFVNTMYNSAYATTKCYAIYSSVANTAYATINYNDYYNSGSHTVLGYLSTDKTTLADWQAATAQDANSVSGNPQFTSLTDLRPGLGTAVLASGTPIGGITVDYSGVTRSGSTPSMGGYENGVDIAGPVLSYTALTNTTSVANRTLSATITDGSGVNTTSAKPRIYFKKKSDANAFGGNTSTDNGWKWTESSTGSSPFSFTLDYSIINGGSITTNDTVQYFVVAQDVNGYVTASPSSGFAGSSVSSVTSAPTSPNGYKIVGAQMAGSYTVGLGLFNRLSGNDLKTVTEMRAVTRRVPVLAADNEAVAFGSAKEQPASQFRFAGTEGKVEYREETSMEPVAVLYQNGAPYTGSLYIGKQDYRVGSGSATVLDENAVDMPDGIEGVYATITAAANDLSERGMSASVSLLLVDAAYNSETFPILFDFTNSSGPSASNTLTLKPNSGVTAAITGSTTGAMFKLNGTDYMTIDGSNNGSTSRDLTITNNTTSPTSSAIIWLSSPGSGNGATNNTVKNLILKGVDSTSLTNGSAIVLSGTTVDAAPLANNNNNVIQNNKISKTTYAIDVIGVSAAAPDSNITVTGNEVGSSAAGDALYNGGIYMQFAKNSTITQNTVTKVNSASSAVLYGIWLATCKDVTVSRNKVYNLGYTGTSTVKLHGIYVTNATFTSSGNPSANLFANNYVANITSTGTSSFYNLGGFFLTNGYGDKFYYNTVYLSGILGGTSSTGDASAFANNNSLNTSVDSAIDVRNNIFINVGSGSATIKAQAIYNLGAAAVLAHSDYNNLYTAAGGSYTSYVGYNSGSNHATLAAWRTATSKDANSVSAAVNFTDASSGNLSLTGASIGNKTLTGTYLAAVTTDYDGETRDAVYPYMGADENTSTKLRLKLNLTALIEGLYDNGGDVAVSDTVKVYLHNATAPYAVVDSSTVVLNTSGAGTAYFRGASNNTSSYYLRVYHRSALETWSAAGNTFASASDLTYNFTTGAEQAYGSNQVLKGTKYCIYSGDVNQDGLADLNDLIAIDNDNANFEYHIENDVNMDALVDLNDMIVVDNNNAAFVGKQVPSKKAVRPGVDNFKTETEK